MHKGNAFVRRPFEKAGETFNLLTATVDALQRANLYLAFVPLLCPRKTPYYKVFARPFSKGRVPLAFPRAYSPRTPRVPACPSSRKNEPDEEHIRGGAGGDA